MRLDLRSWVVGVGTGLGMACLSRWGRPVALGVATALYRVTVSVLGQAEIQPEALAPRVSEARARVRRYAEARA